jgi:hypothetical protein
MVLDIAYAVLSDVRPLFGCESCGTPGPWVRPIAWVVRAGKALFGKNRQARPAPHFTALPGAEGRK